MYNETTVVIKVEGTARASSLPSRTDRWNQDFEIAVDKANEVEVAIYDKQSGSGEGSSAPIGLLWLRLNDVVEALRRQRVGTEGQGAWVTAGAMGPAGGVSPPHDSIYGAGGGGPDPNMRYGQRTSGEAAPEQPQADGITAWFGVEPAGALALDVNFGRWIIHLVTMQAYTQLNLFTSQGEYPPTSVGCWKAGPSRRRAHASS